MTRWLTPWTRLLLALTPAIGLALAWTNELHGLIWAEISLSVVDGLALLAIDYLPYFHFYAAYNCTLILVTALICGAARRASSWPAAPCPRSRLPCN